MLDPLAEPPRLLWRMFNTPEGRAVRASLAPRERSTGVASDVRAIVFETPGGEWIGSTPLVAEYELWSLTNEELQLLFERATG